VDEALPPGKASNAAAVVAFTLGQRHSHLDHSVKTFRADALCPW
jgi:hypothetical protein